MAEIKLNSCDLNIERYHVWYHYPITFETKPTTTQMREVWNLQKPEDLGDFDRRSYFHSFVSDQLFGDGKRKLPTFETYRHNSFPGQSFMADRLHVTGDGKKKPKKFAVTRFHLTVLDAELRIVGGFTRKIAVLSLKVEFTGAERTDWTDTPEQAFAADLKPLQWNLTQVMCAADWVRRVYPRWIGTEDGLPRDSISRFISATSGQPCSNDTETGDGRLLPWVQELFRPFTFGGTSPHAEVTAEERAFMSSVIAIEPADLFKESDRADADTIASITDGDLMRLAEADPKSPGDPSAYYSPEFLEQLKPAIFYDRHAPHKDAETYRSTRYLITAQHFCAIGAGEFANDTLLNHFDKYYRHMHFLCIFEYYQLIGFSQQITDLVRAYHKDVQGKPPTAHQLAQFTDNLSRIRAEFLTYTHLHHFSNVSSQLQPREMFARLYKAFEIGTLYDEVEREISSASDFATAEEERRISRRSEAWNEFVMIGVPVGLAATIVATWFMIWDGSGIEDVYPATFRSFWGRVSQAAFTSAVVFLVWLVATSLRGTRTGAWRMDSIAFLALAVITLVSWISMPTNEEVRNSFKNTESRLEKSQGAETE